MSRSRLASILVVVLLVAACGGATVSPTPGDSSPAPTGSAGSPTDASPPAATASPDGSTPVESATPAVSSAPSATDQPTASPTDTLQPGGATACSGSDNNRAFFANFARSIPWHVFCPVLPKPWFVDSGISHVANGGSLVISYKSPGGARLTLSEGTFCKDASGCVPAVADSGSATFGSLSGLVYDLSGLGSGNDGWAIVVDGGQAPMWKLETHGLDRASSGQLAAALAEVGS